MTEKGTWDTTLKMLSRRALSQAELKAKLGAKGHSEESTESAAAKAKKYGFINDEQYSLYLAQRELAKLKGPLRITQTLTQHGINESLAAQTISQLKLNQPEAELKLAKKALNKKTRGRSLSEIQKYRFLASQGFTEDTLEKLTNDLSS